MGILFLKLAALVMPKNHDAGRILDDELSKELCKAHTANSTAAQRLEGTISDLLDNSLRLRQGMYWKNAPNP